MNATCQNCNKEFTYGHSKTGKFCSNQCSGEYKVKPLEKIFGLGINLTFIEM